MTANKNDLFFEKGLMYGRNYPGRPTKYILVLSAGKKKIKTISFMKYKGSTSPDDQLRVNVETEDVEYFGRWSEYKLVSLRKRVDLFKFIFSCNSVVEG